MKMETAGIIMLNFIHAPEDFPLGPADIKEPEKDGAPRTCSWGAINDRPYAERGWCCAEFSVALKNNRIVNLQDPHVQQVLDIRRWPSTVGQYAAMMDDDAVRFTNKGDLAAAEPAGQEGQADRCCCRRRC